MTSQSSGPLGFPLIRTKLNAPRKTSDLVVRPRLAEKLNRGLTRKVTLISAPAGYGKTTLLHSWLESCDLPSVWLSLDENDNDMARFVSYFIASIHSRYPNVCDATSALMDARRTLLPDYVAASLVNDIAEVDEHFVFAIDDFHLIHNADIQQLLLYLIKVQPVRLHLAIACRSDPPLMLARLRADHQLTEVRLRDLRFTEQEAAQFFKTAVDQDIDRATVSALNQLAEGWTVGLRLTALALQAGRSAASILRDFRDGSSDFVTDYLMGEVLKQQPPSVQEFLLRTSILSRFCVELSGVVCYGSDDAVDNAGNAVIGNSQLAADNLAHLRSANLFVVSLDKEQGWYRYHHLFVEMLRQRLLSSHSHEQVENLHRRASRWFAENAYLEEAVRHALAANDTDSAVKLVESQCSNLLNAVDRSVLEKWLTLLPETAIWRSPRILLARAWILFRQWNMTALDSVLDAIESLLDEAQLADEARKSIGGQMSVLRSVTAYVRHHNFQSAVELSRAGSGQVAVSERDARSLALFVEALGCHAIGETAAAIETLTRNLEDLSPDNPGKTQSYIALARIHHTMGNFAEMQRIIRQMLSFASRSDSFNAEAGANYVAGFLTYELNDLDSAETHFTRVFQLRFSSNLMGGVVGGLGMVRINQLAGEFNESQERIDALYSELLDLGNTFLLPLVDAAQAQQWLLMGKPDGALRWARAFKSDVLQNCIFSLELPALIQARILIRFGTRAEVRNQARKLREQLAVLEAAHFTNRVIQALAHLALAYDRLGEPARALDSLKRSVGLARSAGFIRSIVDAGADILPYLRQVHEQEETPEYTSVLLDAARRSSPADPRIYPDKVKTGAEESELLEPLTRREDAVLRLIGRGLTNQEIAEEMVISPHTVKTHASNIYAKLGVTGRARAIHRAKRLGILPNEP